MAIIFTSGQFIASTFSKAIGDHCMYVMAYDGTKWTYTLERREAMYLTAEQANRFKDDMRAAAQLAMLEPVR
jgi:hypothetical protein